MPSPLPPLPPLLLLVALLPVASLASMGKGPRLTLSPANVINAFGVPVSGGGAQGVGALLDEQALAGDPAAGTGGAVVSAWMPGYAQWYYPWVNALVDLGGTYTLEQVRPHRGILDANTRDCETASSFFNLANVPSRCNRQYALGWQVWMNHHNGDCKGRMVFGDCPFTPLAVVAYGTKRPWYSTPWQGYNVSVTAREILILSAAVHCRTLALVRIPCHCQHLAMPLLLAIPPSSARVVQCVVCLSSYCLPYVRRLCSLLHGLADCHQRSSAVRNSGDTYPRSASARAAR